MSQQTRLETVVDYYVRWMEQFPTVEALAAATQRDVLKAWEGLGYYSRARNLQKAARKLVDEHNGQLPGERVQLLALPGIGEYTAGAILSMAFGQAEPLLDGNVKRVISRLFDIEQPVNEQETIKQLWSIARALVEASPPDKAGVFNEALMELGATVCTPRNPRCLLCPLTADCASLAKGTQNERPVKPARKQTPHWDVAAGIIWAGEPHRSPVLIAQRPSEGLLGGLWEFPGGKLEEEDVDLAACLRREIEEELNASIEVGEKVAVVPHAYTHFRITLHAFHARYVGGEISAIGCADWCWADFDQLDQFPFPVTDRKVIEIVRNNPTQLAEIPSERSAAR